MFRLGITNSRQASLETYERLLPIPEGDRVWGEKTPSNLLYMEELNDLYPNALFIHITREPGAVLLSYYNKKLASSKTDPVKRDNGILEFFALHSMRWAILMGFALQVEKKLGPSIIHRIKYEDLLSSPDIVMRTICDRIGVQYDPSLLDEKSRRVSKILHPSTSYAHPLLEKPLDVSRAQVGKEVPSLGRYIINKYAGNVLEHIGYESVQMKHYSLGKIFYVECMLTIQKKKIYNRIKCQLESWGVNCDLSAINRIHL
jgi:Sulfotransferase family